MKPSGTGSLLAEDCGEPVAEGVGSTEGQSPNILPSVNAYKCTQLPYDSKPLLRTATMHWSALHL